jgi:putative membrane protein
VIRRTPYRWGMHMSATGAGLRPFDHHAFFSTWHLHPWWLLVGLALLGGYAFAARRAAAHGRPVPSWRVACFAVGVGLLELTLASAIDAYAMAIFWMHMIEHLLLIMIVPALLVLGHPLSTIRDALPEGPRERYVAFLVSKPIGFLTDPLLGIVVYGAVIVGTHLTGFMDQMAMHEGLMTLEQVLYLVAGVWLLLPLVGHEPLRWNVPYVLRLALLLVAMVPDTVVGIVLMQTNSDPFPTMMAMHPAWSPDPVHDTNIGGALMWAAGDGLMMATAIGVVIAMIVDRDESRKGFGAWLEGARQQALVHHVEKDGQDQVAVDIDPDGEDALAAYNRMLGRLSGD